MPDYTETINLFDHKRGDKWVGIASIGPVTINDAQPAVPLSRIRAEFVHPSGLVFTLDSESDPAPDAPVTIDNAVTWEAHVDEVMDFLPLAGDWSWDMEFWAGTEDAPLTLYAGTITVHDDTTKNY